MSYRYTVIFSVMYSMLTPDARGNEIHLKPRVQTIFMWALCWTVFFIFHFFFVFCFLVNGWSCNVVVNCYLFMFFHLLRSYVASLSFGTFVTSKSLALMSEYNKNEKRKTETPFKFLLIRTLPKCNEDFFFVE